MRPTRPPPHPRHLAAALASAGLVLAIHGLLLSGLQRPASGWRGGAATPVRAVQVRQMVLQTPGAPLPGSATGPGRASPPAPVIAPVIAPVGAAAAMPGPVTRPPAEAAAGPDAAQAAVRAPHKLPVGVAVPGPSPASSTALASPSEAGDGLQAAAGAPVYATRLPPPSTLHYSLRRGGSSGHAVLRWSPEDGRYDLTLHGRLSAAPTLAWASQGRLDAHGIAPDRYTESRRGREVRAANFQRESARITFSGPQLEYPLPPGAQDRLSWMLQLGAVLAADPSLETAGREVLLFVVGSRGDAEVWTFTVHGRENTELPGAGSVPCVLLRRQPRREHDTQVEVWLDPARHHLPVRAHLSVRGDRTEFMLEQLSQP